MGKIYIYIEVLSDALPPQLYNIRLHLTISETFRNQQSDIQTHFQQQLARCVEVRKLALFSFFAQFLSIFVGTAECDTMNAFQGRLSENEHRYAHM